MKYLTWSFLLFSSAGYSQVLGKETLNILIKKEQALVDAIAVGDKNIWMQYLHDSCLITTEDGSMITKQKFIESLNPLPAGYIGRIQIIEPKFMLSGNTAVLSFIDDEYLELYNQRIHTQYRQTDTWMKINSEWKMIAMQLFEIPKPPKPVQIDTVILKKYTGFYELSETRTCTVYIKNGNLFIKKGGNKPYEILAQTEHVFFKEGDGRVDIIFQKNEKGKYNMIERREGEDLVWRRTN